MKTLIFMTKVTNLAYGFFRRLNTNLEGEPGQEMFFVVFESESKIAPGRRDHAQIVLLFPAGGWDNLQQNGGLRAGKLEIRSFLDHFCSE